MNIACRSTVTNEPLHSFPAHDGEVKCVCWLHTGLVTGAPLLASATATLAAAAPLVAFFAVEDAEHRKATVA